VLDGAGHAVFAPRDLAEAAMDVEVDGRRAHGPVRQDHAAVGRPRLHTDLADPDAVAAARAPVARELRAQAIEVRPELGLGRVLLADLADLATDADGHAVGLEGADERDHLGRPLVVRALLGVL